MGQLARALKLQSRPARLCKFVRQTARPRLSVCLPGWLAAWRGLDGLCAHERERGSRDNLAGRPEAGRKFGFGPLCAVVTFAAPSSSAGLSGARKIWLVVGGGPQLECWRAGGGQKTHALVQLLRGAWATCARHWAAPASGRAHNTHTHQRPLCALHTFNGLRERLLGGRPLCTCRPSDAEVAPALDSIDGSLALPFASAPRARGADYWALARGKCARVTASPARRACISASTLHWNGNARGQLKKAQLVGHADQASQRASGLMINGKLEAQSVPRGSGGTLSMGCAERLPASYTIAKHRCPFVLHSRPTARRRDGELANWRALISPSVAALIQFVRPPVRRPVARRLCARLIIGPAPPTRIESARVDARAPATNPTGLGNKKWSAASKQMDSRRASERAPHQPVA